MKIQMIKIVLKDPMEGLKYFAPLFQIKSKRIKYIEALIKYVISGKNLFPATLVKLHGKTFLARSGGIDIAILSSLYERKTTKFIMDKSPCVFMDIGAHIGRFSLMAASRGSDVISVEPSKENFKSLTRNISINHLEGKVTPLNIGCSDKKGQGTLFFIPTYEGSSSFKSNPDEDTLKEKCQMETLDDITRKLDLKKLDLIKIDVESLESMVLKGGEYVLEYMGPTLIIEILSEKDEIIIRKYLEGFDYKFLNILDGRNFVFEKEK